MSNNQSKQSSNSGSGSLTSRLPDAAAKHVGKAVGVAAAAVASAIAVRAFRRLAGTNEEESIFHLKQMNDEWALLLEGESKPEQTFSTKEEGLKAARELAQKNMPCDLVVYRMDGTIQDRHSYATQ